MSQRKHREVIYVLVSRRNKPLADYATRNGAFDQFTSNVLRRLNYEPGQYTLDYDK